MEITVYYDEDGEFIGFEDEYGDFYSVEVDEDSLELADEL